MNVNIKKIDTLQDIAKLTPKHSSSYLAYLDGLRAFAIIAVLLFHGDNNWLHGGFLGVEIFFVISGFIISKLLFELLAQLRTKNKIIYIKMNKTESRD